MGPGDIVILVLNPVCIGVSVCMTLSCLQYVLLTSGWILIKFSYNWDITKNWFNFGVLDLIFKITAIEKLEVHSWVGCVCVCWVGGAGVGLGVSVSLKKHCYYFLTPFSLELPR